MSHVAPPGFPSFSAPLPKHPRSQTALVLGIISVSGIVCALPIFLSPFAWYYGARVRREIAAWPDRWSGGSEASAGMILGIIGTVLLVIVLGLLAFATVALGWLTHSHTYY